MASGYEHAPVTQALSVLILVLSIFLGSLTNDGILPYLSNILNNVLATIYVRINV